MSTAMAATVHLPRPFDWQRMVVRDAHRFNICACGRRSGKSTMAHELMLRPALDGYPVGYFAPTYKLLGETWRMVARLARPISRSMNASDHRIELLTGGVIEMWTLEDPNAGRSRKYKRVVVDEAGLCADLGERWTAAILPTLADYEGDAWLLGTPKGRNFFWQAWRWGQDPLRPDWASWQMPTTVNPKIKPSEIEMLRESMPEMTYQQEIEAAFLESSGGVFRKVRDAATAPHVEPYAGDFVMGVDWAQMHDFTVLTVLDRTSRRMVDWQRFNQVDWALQRGHLTSMARKWKVSTIVAERNSIGSPNIEALQRGQRYERADILLVTDGHYLYAHHQGAGHEGPFNYPIAKGDVYGCPYNPDECRYGRTLTVDNPLVIPASLWSKGEYSDGLPVMAFDTTASSKPPLIESLVLAFERSEIGILSNEVLIGELEAYERIVSEQTGRSRYSAPEGQHDDCVMSLALAWRGVTHGGIQVFSV